MFEKIQISLFLLLICSTFTNAQKEVLFFQTDWGFEGEAEVFIKRAKDSGYDGVEILAPMDVEKLILPFVHL